MAQGTGASEAGTRGTVPWRPVAIAFLAGLALFAAVFGLTRGWQSERARSEFRRAVAIRAGALQRSLDRHLEALHALRAFYRSSHFVERAEFERFAGSLMARRPALTAMATARPIPARGLGVAAARSRDAAPASGPATRRAGTRHPIRFVRRRGAAPGDGARALDLGRHPACRAAMREARRRDGLATTPPIRWEPITGDRRAVLAFAPLPDGRRGGEDPRGRTAAGVALAVIEPERLLAEAPGSDPRITARFLGAPGAGDAPAAESPTRPGAFRAVEQLRAGRRPWRVTFASARSAWNGLLAWAPWGLLLGGGIFSGALATYIGWVLSRRAWVERLAEERASELVAARERIEETDHEIAIARHIQESLHPPEPPEVPGYEIAARCRACQAVGGDYFDYLSVSDRRILMVVGDAAGHGLGPALLVSEIQAAIRSLSLTTCDPGAIVRGIHRVMAGRVPEGRFVTLLVACLDRESGAVRYTNAGHPSGLVFTASAELTARLESTDAPIGVFPESAYPEGDPVRLRPGSTLLLCSDGILEARSAEGEAFGTKRLIRLVSERPGEAPDELLDRLHHNVRAYCGGDTSHDDCTTLALRMTRPAAGAAS